MLVRNKTGDQSGVAIGKEMLRENERNDAREIEREKTGRERGTKINREGERIVKDDVRDRRIATMDSVKDVEIPRTRETVRVMFIDDMIYK